MEMGKYEKIHLIHYRGEEIDDEDTVLRNNESKAEEVGFESYTNVDSSADLLEMIQLLLRKNTNIALALWFKLDDIFNLKTKDIPSDFTLEKVEALFRKLEAELVKFNRNKIAVIFDTYSLKSPEVFADAVKKSLDFGLASSLLGSDCWRRAMTETRRMISKQESAEL